MSSTDGWAVRALVGKHTQATKQLKMAEETLAKVEATVRNKSEDGAEKLRAWKKAEASWLRRVLDLTSHRDLENPYEPRKERGECLDSNSCRVLTRRQGLTQREMLNVLEAKSGSAGSASQGMIGSIAEGIELAEIR